MKKQRKYTSILLLIIIFIVIIPIILNNYSFVSKIGNPILTQPIEDKEMWEEYVSLGLYRTTITNNMTLEEIQNEIEKSHIYITSYRPLNTKYGLRLRATSISHGSGFVIDMDENNIYIATNQHVIDSYNGKTYGYYILFSNINKQANEIMDKYELKGELVDFNYNPDYAIVKIDISNVPYNERYTFKTIPKIEEIQLEQGMPIYMYHMKKDCEPTLKEGSLKTTNTTTWPDGSICYQVTPISVDGDSGSLLFTNKGQCLGILIGKKDGNTNAITYN